MGPGGAVPRTAPEITLNRNTSRLPRLNVTAETCNAFCIAVQVRVICARPHNEDMQQVELSPGHAERSSIVSMLKMCNKTLASNHPNQKQIRIRIFMRGHIATFSLALTPCSLQVRLGRLGCAVMIYVTESENSRFKLEENAELSITSEFEVALLRNRLQYPIPQSLRNHPQPPLKPRPLFRRNALGAYSNRQRPRQQRRHFGEHVGFVR